MWITSSLNTVNVPTSIALGNFDGLHLGHRQVIQPIVLNHSSVIDGLDISTGKFLFYLARWLGDRASHPVPPSGQAALASPPEHISPDTAESSLHNSSLHNSSLYESPLQRQGAIPTVVTFAPHPQEFFTGKRRSLLTPLMEKAAYLQSMGVQQLVLLPFDRELANLEPEEFVQSILLDGLQVKQVSIGQDFCFGRQRSGTASDLRAIAMPNGVEVHIVPLHREGEERISSSAIRQALKDGHLHRANQLLGRPYTLIGKVVEGQKLGRSLGFPTANLTLPPEKFIPCYGVYAVLVHSPAWNHAEPVPGVINIGMRPTVNGIQQTIEVHLFDWSGDLYGQTLVVGLVKFLRPEQKFASLDALKDQIQQDCHQARSHLADHPLL